MDLHEFLDCTYGLDGDRELARRIASGEDLAGADAQGDRPLHVAARRRRARAVELLLEAGAEVDARNGLGKSAFAHAARRGFDDVVAVLRRFGANETLNPADELAVALSRQDLESARALLAAHPGIARTGNAEEDRLLADLAGRSASEPVALLIEAGADLAAPGLDGGTPLHQTAWFGQPQNARLLVDAGAPLDVFDPTHTASPIHWGAHGSRYSGGAAGRQEAYVEVARILLEAGCGLCYPGDPGGAYLERILRDARPTVADLVRAHMARRKG